MDVFISTPDVIHSSSSLFIRSSRVNEWADARGARSYALSFRPISPSPLSIYSATHTIRYRAPQKRNRGDTLLHVHLYFCGDHSPLNKTSNMNEKWFRILAIAATCASILMYVSYISQIQMNLSGQKGTPIQPLCAAFNCTLWTTYGLFKKPAKDWPIILANIPGIILGLITFATSF